MAKSQDQFGIRVEESTAALSYDEALKAEILEQFGFHSVLTSSHFVETL